MMSTEALHTQLQTRLKTFVPRNGGDTIGTRLGNRVWKVWPAENAVFPYMVTRLMNNLQRPKQGESYRVDLEAMLFGRTIAHAPIIEGIADIADQAFLRYTDNTSGLLFTFKDRQRDTLPPPVEPADREVVTIRLVYPFTVWPLYLTQYATP